MVASASDKFCLIARRRVTGSMYILVHGMGRTRISLRSKIGGIYLCTGTQIMNTVIKAFQIRLTVLYKYLPVKIN